MQEALYYDKRENGVTVCRLCPHNCHIEKEKYGACRARKNMNGTLIAESYGKATSLHLDPIEKKPLYKFYPNTMILSVGSYGCNMNCPYCQNHSISQQITESQFISPQELLEIAKRTPHNIGIAFTYNEPTMSYEYIVDTAPLFKQAGLKVVLVTNGMISQSPLKDLLPYIDAVNIDIKTFNPSKYKTLGGDLEAIMKTVETCAEAGTHVEITSLIVPGQNDSTEEMAAQAQWIAKISTKIPLHLSRFFPNYKMIDCTPTPIQILKKLEQIAGEYLDNIYLGNV